jgi:ankyrin repeat protein
VKLLISLDVDINKAINNGDTPFCIACYNGHLEIVKLLISLDVDIIKLLIMEIHLFV